MSLRFGSIDPAALKFGSADVQRVYLGAEQVWPVDSGLSFRDAVLQTSPHRYYTLDGTLAPEVGANNAVLQGVATLAGASVVPAEPDAASVESTSGDSYTYVDGIVMNTQTGGTSPRAIQFASTKVGAVGGEFAFRHDSSLYMRTNSSGQILIVAAETYNTGLPASLVDDGDPHLLHLCWTTGGLLKFWVDGTLVYSTAKNTAARANLTGRFYVGKNATFSSWRYGRYAHLATWDYDISDVVPDLYAAWAA